ncbi:hypothetical protein SPSYN_02058 [Sporotomaculum syntrophicum]|uniref:Uncharacterized protein n=1 Tax=Sporotomaculum syntrophicum TaxID=182264 RepID=A0A9D2WPV0_9FIRM|nr:hypothetical protein [Sporotomaculum syntrophicum]KAF1084888.1 hypothetical protein SPSYN_02058 [Sporotomaculum syntrophicum]
MSNQKYQCCFCDKNIESNQFDITALIVVSNWDKKQDLQQEQQLFCHIECLRSKLVDNVPLYIADIIE